MLKRGAAAVAIAAVFVALALEVVAQTTHQSASPAVAPSRTAAATPSATPVDMGSIRFQRLDTNHDGKLSREEASRSSFLSKHFDEIDTNHDGFITPDEKRAAWKARLEARNKAAASHPAAGAVAQRANGTQQAQASAAIPATQSTVASAPRHTQ